MIRSKQIDVPVFAADGAITFASQSVTYVRLQIEGYRTVEAPLELFIAALDKARTLRQFGVILDDLCEAYDVTGIEQPPARAKAAVA